MEILFTVMWSLFSLLTPVNWLVVITTFVVIVSMLLIVLWVFHPANRDSYESHASIPLDDVIDGEPVRSPKPQCRFSIFL